MRPLSLRFAMDRRIYPLPEPHLSSGLVNSDGALFPWGATFFPRGARVTNLRDTVRDSGPFPLGRRTASQFMEEDGATAHCTISDTPVRYFPSLFIS